MQKIQLKDFNLLEFGNTIQVAGVIYANSEEQYLCYFADEKPIEPFKVLELDVADWEKIIRQTDILETEVLANSPDGKLCKIVIRKSIRQVEQGVSWKVYHRDDYRCRYCHIQGVPMTVDHLVLWEHGGPSIEANLLTACRKCNKTRGNTVYADWLNHPQYIKMSRNLPPEIKEANAAVAATLADIPVRLHQRAR